MPPWLTTASIPPDLPLALAGLALLLWGARLFPALIGGALALGSVVVAWTLVPESATHFRWAVTVALAGGSAVLATVLGRLALRLGGAGIGAATALALLPGTPEWAVAAGLTGLLLGPALGRQSLRVGAPMAGAVLLTRALDPGDPMLVFLALTLLGALVQHAWAEAPPQN